MKLPSEEIEVVPQVPASPAKLALVAILAALLGVSLTLLIVGVWLHYQQRAAWGEQVQTLQDVVQKNNIALSDLRAQNASLAKQLKLLKEYSIASSTSGQTASAEPAAAAAGAVKPAVSAAARPSAAGKAKRARAQDCELVGKTPEQQAATLRRCVGLIDPPSDQPRP